MNQRASGISGHSCMMRPRDSIFHEVHDSNDRRGRPAARPAAGGSDVTRAATSRLDTSRDVTSRARQGGAGDTAGKQMGLLELISAPVPALTGRTRQKRRSGTTKSAPSSGTLFPKRRKNDGINVQFAPLIRLQTA